MIEIETQELIARTATMDDAEAVAALINLCAQHEEGITTTDANETRRDWDWPHFNLETDVILLVTPDNELLGYAGFYTTPPYVQPWAWARVHPDHRGRGIGTRLMTWIEERAAQDLDRAPNGVCVALKSINNRRNQDAPRLLLAHGYDQTRYYWRMMIELDREPPVPAWPEGIRVRAMVRGQEDRAVLRTLETAFQDHFGFVKRPEDEAFKEFTHWLDTDPFIDPALLFVAVSDTPAGEQIVGMSLCQHSLTEDPDMAYVAELGVLSEYRRRGIALALLHHSFRAFYQRGKPRASLHVDAASLTGATRLYEKAGMHVDREYVEFTKVLREGEDLSTQTLES